MEMYTGQLPKGFCYIPQDNYIICNPQKTDYNYLYSDSATSCIIIVLIGTDKDGQPLVALTHLSRDVRYNAFFDLVREHFCGGIAVYAQGANPPYPVEKKGAFAYDAIENTVTLINWINDLIHIPNQDDVASQHFITQCSLSLGTGDPNSGLGAYGINLDSTSSEYLKVSNKNFILTPDVRDPDGGLQTLFCIFGTKTNIETLLLRQAGTPFTIEEKNALVSSAKERNWERLCELSDETILDNYSTTPEYEPVWFCDNIRASGRYVRDYKEVSA